MRAASVERRCGESGRVPCPLWAVAGGEGTQQGNEPHTCLIPDHLSTQEPGCCPGRGGIGQGSTSPEVTQTGGGPQRLPSAVLRPAWGNTRDVVGRWCSGQLSQRHASEPTVGGVAFDLGRIGSL